jgi:hypothetical protein
MATTSNPFEPPRTTDLDGERRRPRRHRHGQLVLSEEALQELIAAAPVGALADPSDVGVNRRGLVQAVALNVVPATPGRPLCLPSRSHGDLDADPGPVAPLRHGVGTPPDGPREAAGQASRRKALVSGCWAY